MQSEMVRCGLCSRPLHMNWIALANFHALDFEKTSFFTFSSAMMLSNCRILRKGFIVLHLRVPSHSLILNGIKSTSFSSLVSELCCFFCSVFKTMISDFSRQHKLHENNAALDAIDLIEIRNGRRILQFSLSFRFG